MASAALFVFPELGLSREQRKEFLSRHKPSSKKSFSKRTDNTSHKTHSIFARTTTFLSDLKTFFISPSQHNDENKLVKMGTNMAASMEMQEEERDYLQKLPNEVLEEIFSYLDKDSVKNLRVVNKRCKKVVDSSKEILKKFDVKQANRLVIRYLHEKKFYEFRWCNYESKTTRKMYITSEELKNGQIFYFAFKQMSFQRVMFKNLSNKSLSNEVLYFLCKHFSYCPKFEPTNLSFENVDFCVLSPTLLNRLLELCGQFLETFQINNAYGLNRNSINDSHIKQLNPLKIKRLTMQSMKFLSSIYHKKVLKITDESIKWLMSAGQFPTLVFEHCQITTPIMCRYIECWLKKAARDTVNTNIKSHSFMLKHCPSVSSEIFEKECIERKLSYSKSSPESSSTPEQTYTLFNENSSTVKYFTITFNV